MNNAPDIGSIINLPIFFILGRPRSGTTLLRTVLDAHPQISLPPENGNLIHLCFKYGKARGIWNARKIDSFLRDFAENRAIKTFWNVDFSLARELILSFKEHPLAFPDIIRIIYYCNQSPVIKQGIRVMGDKSPINSLYAKELMSIFPGARFIHLVRDYRANLASMSNHDLFPASISRIVLMWKKSVQQVNSLAHNHPSLYLMLKYEDFVADPGKHAAAICRFLDVPYFPSILDPVSRKEVVSRSYDPGFIREWQPELSGEISTGNIDKWKGKLTRREILTAECLAGKTGEELGYLRIFGNPGPLLRLTGFFKRLVFFTGEMQRHLFDRLPYTWKPVIRNRRFILSRELLLLYRRVIGN